jgi:DNA-binding transcriptional LysR family regulator
MQLLTPANHPLARKRRVQAQDLRAYPFVLAEPSTPNRRAQEHLLRDDIDHLHVIMEAYHAEVVLKFVSSGLGIALWFIHDSVAHATPGLHARIFDPHFERLGVFLVYRKHGQLPEPVREFCQVTRRLLRERRD